MSWGGDVFKFEGFNLGHMWDKIKDNPARIFYGGIDPASTKLWNAVLGRHDKPLVDQMGGATPDTYTAARERGINVGPGQTMHGIAHLIAGAEAGGYGVDALGGVGAPTNPGGSLANGGLASGGTTWTPATIDSALGTSGYGASSAGAGGGAGVYEPIASGAPSSGSSWQNALRQFRMPQQQQQQGAQLNSQLLAQALRNSSDQQQQQQVGPAMPIQSFAQPYSIGLMRGSNGY